MTQPNEADIDVIMTKVVPSSKWPDGVEFDLQSDLKSNDRLTFDNNGKPGFKLKFTIKDEGQTGYLFPDNPAKAMWVKPVSSDEDDCPETQMFWEEFVATEVTGNNRTLKVTNLNGYVQTFKFTLLFTKTPRQNGPCIPFDPIGQNQNGQNFR